jgi:hypothetical protein
VTIGPEQVVTPPVATAPAHSLVASAQSVSGSGDRWQNGLVWLPELCGVNVGTWIPCPIDAAGAPVSGAPLTAAGTTPGLEAYKPFVVEMEAPPCAGVWMADELRARANRQFEAYYPSQVEREFWGGLRYVERPDGTVGPNFALRSIVPNQDAFAGGLGHTQPGLLNGTTTVQAGTALDLIEQAMAGCAAGSRGMIHASAGTVSEWVRKGYVQPNGVRLVTKNRGDIVVSYSGTAPDGPRAVTGGAETASKTNVWAYATSMVTIREGDVDATEMPTGSTLANRRDGSVAGAFTPRTNQLSFTLRRAVAVVADPCCAFAVRITGPATEGVDL